MKQKNILFTDMDGTILFSDNGKTYFKESDLDAIKEFQIGRASCRERV